MSDRLVWHHLPVSARTGGRARGGWRDTDVWLDPNDVQWFGELARTVQARALLPPPLLAAGNAGTAAWPPPGPSLRLPARAVTPSSARPSRRRRLATRLVPTLAIAVAAAAGGSLLLTSRVAEPLLAAPEAFRLQDLQTPAPVVDSAVPTAPDPTAAGAAAVRPGARPPSEPSAGAAAVRKPTPPAIRWRSSQTIGVPHAGRLVNGVRLPVEGPGWVTWDPVLHRTPNRVNRLFGTDVLVRRVLDVIGAYRAAHPKAPPLVVGDLSRRGGGEIDQHASHENGLDVDVYYPRSDRLLRPPRTVAQVDMRLAQDLLDRFVAAGAQVVFVGQSVGLRGPRGVVVPYPAHDNHMHVRLPAASAGSR
jgi:murein endopeptidase